MIKEGEKRRSILTGKVYQVKARKDRFVVLGSLDGSSQVRIEPGLDGKGQPETIL